MALVVLTGCGRDGAPSDAVAMNLKVVGHTDLDGPGPYGASAAVGSTVLVGPGTNPGADPCRSSAVKVVSVTRPSQPRVVATIDIPPGLLVTDLDASDVSSPTFTGDLVAVALQARGGEPLPCGEERAGTHLYDLAKPERPRLLGEMAGCRGCAGSQSVSVGQRRDGRILAVTLSAGLHRSVETVDVTDPSRPMVLSRWSPTDTPHRTNGGCSAAPELVTVSLHDLGERVLLAFDDGGVVDLDLADPSHPIPARQYTPVAGSAALGRAVGAAAVPIGNRTVAVVAGVDDPPAGCDRAGATEGGLRLISLDSQSPRETGAARFAGESTPGRLVVSGEYAFVSWHAEGLQVIDLGLVEPRITARFAPGVNPDVTGVALLPSHVIAVDRTSGLYVLERPEEGRSEPFGSRAKSALAYIAFGLLVALAAIARFVPMLFLGRALSRSGSRGRGARRVL